MNLSDLLAELGARFNLGMIELGDDGTCQLTFDGKTTVNFEQAQDPAFFHLYAVIAGVPVDSEPTLRRLLAANLFGQGTGQAVLAIDPDEDEILLTRTMKADDTSPEVFIQALESFVGHAEHWSRELAGPLPSADPDQGEPGEPPQVPGGMRV